MQHYSPKEAELQAWKRKLANVQTKRIPLHQQLMTILNDTRMNTDARYQAFHNLKSQLLSKEHGQGWTWNSHLQWISRLFNFFSLSWKGPFPGSRLRDALLTTPRVIIRPLFTRQDYDKCKPLPQKLSTKDYENSLFEQPIKALADIKHRLTQEDVNVINHIHALKYQINAHLYQHLLDLAYQKYPKDSLIYFYECYLNDTIDSSKPQDFIELHKMALSLIDYFVTNDHPIHGGLHLLSLLSLEEPEALLQELKGQDLLLEANTNDTKLPPLRRLTDYCQDIDSSKHIEPHYKLINKIRHPLIKQVSRLLIEHLFIDNIKSPQETIWKSGHYGFDSISLMAKHILKTDFVGFNPKHPYKFFNSLIHSPLIPKEMQRAEQYAVELILAHARNKDLCIITMRRLRCEQPTKMSPFEIEWIMSRLSGIDHTLLPLVKHMLGDIKVYSDIKTNQPNQTANDLLNAIDNYLNQAKQAFLLLNSDDENQAISHAIEAFHQCLSYQDLKGEELHRLFNRYLPQLSLNYMTTELCQTWRNTLRAMQSKTMLWTEEDIANIKKPITKPILEHVNEHLQKAEIAHGNEYHSDFIAEQDESKQAVYYLAHYFKQPILAEHEEAQSLLLRLKTYLAPAQFAKWSKQLSLINAADSSFSNHPASLFYQPLTPVNDTTTKAANNR